MAIGHENARPESRTGDLFANERFGYEEPVAFVRQHGVVVDAMDVAAARVLPRPGVSHVGTAAATEAPNRRLLPECFVGPHLVVFRPEVGERPLEAAELGRHAPPAQALPERAMKSFDLALGL